MKLAVGDVFVYGENGVCRVDDIRKETFGGKEQTYCIIRPTRNSTSTIHIPVDSPALEKRAREVLTREQVLSLVDEIARTEPYWIANDNERSDHFKRIISDGERLPLLMLLKSVYVRRKELAGCGRRLHAADDALAKRAEKLIRDEIAWVMQMDEESVMPFIFERNEAAALL